jgi:GTP cyclohydrolase IA
MSDRVILTHNDIFARAERLAKQIRAEHNGAELRAFPIPTGGVPAAYMLKAALPELNIIHDPADATLFVDDIVDSGRTLARWHTRHPAVPFYSLVSQWEFDRWVVFPWENGEDGDVRDNIVRLIQFIGDDPEREGLQETPARVEKAWRDWTCGYKQDAGEVLKAFRDGGEVYDEMVVVRGLPFYSHCEHHLAPFFGTADIAYVPNGKIVGLSKLSRLLDVFAKRLQVQERLTGQVADALMEHLSPKGAGVTIRARHLCMESRGIQKQGHETITNALRGVIYEDPRARAEFLSLPR